MFDLERAIAGWRRQMLDAGIKTPVPLEELETHLREEIERRVKAGLDEQEAFEIAAQRIGQAQLLKNEFKKVERNTMTRLAIILLGIFAIFVGPALILPALAKHRNLGIWNFDIIWPIIAGAVITVVGISIAAFGFKKRKA